METCSYFLLICKYKFRAQLSNPVYSKLFDLFCHGGKAGQLFVLQFVPVLIWTYLSATTRKDEQVLRSSGLVYSNNTSLPVLVTAHRWLSWLSSLKITEENVLPL